MKPGSLIVVGTGIRTVGQLTSEALAWMQVADKLLYLVNDPVAVALMKRQNPHGVESLLEYYAEGKPRRETYREMVEHILSRVREGYATCVACYGHPGVFVNPTHESVRRARAEGFYAKMLPGISAEDCLFADLGIDPGVHGCQSYEATDFLLNQRQVDPTSSVILWQVGSLGDATFRRHRYNLSALPMLVARLCMTYPAEHKVFLYEAAMFYGCDPVLSELSISELSTAKLEPMTTVYIPPAKRANPNMALYEELAAINPDFMP